MADKVVGEQKDKFLSQLFEIERQLRQNSGYPFDSEKLKKYLQFAVEGRFFESCHWAVWRTIQLGTHKKVDGLIRAITQNGYDAKAVKESLESGCFSLLKQPISIDLVIIKNKDLGFSNGATWERTFERASSVGLFPCPVETGPQLRKYDDDPEISGELMIASEPITGIYWADKNYPMHFHVGYHKLGMYVSKPDTIWSPEAKWVFTPQKL